MLYPIDSVIELDEEQDCVKSDYNKLEELLSSSEYKDDIYRYLCQSEVSTFVCQR